MIKRFIFSLCAFFTLMLNSSIADIVHLPVNYDEYGSPLITLDILGEQRLFIFDTGFAYSMALSSLDIEKFGQDLIVLPPEKSVNLAGKVFEDKRFLLKNYQSNGLKVANADIIQARDWATTIHNDGSATSYDESSKYESYSIAGLGLFRDTLALFNFKENEIILYSGQDREKYLALNALKSINGDINRFGIEIHVMMNNQNISLLLDTGSTSSVAKIFGKHVYGEKDACRQKYSEIEDEDCYIGSFQYNNESIEYPIIVWTKALENFDGDGLIGMDNIKNKDFIVDFVDKKTYFLDN